MKISNLSKNWFVKKEIDFGGFENRTELCIRLSIGVSIVFSRCTKRRRVL